MPEGQVLEFTHVTKRFNEVTAVSDFSARVEPGAVTAFLGPNGAGKTTTLRILLGQVRATSGTATIGGTAYAELRQPLRTIGSVLEETVYRPRRTAERQLTIAAKANGIPLARVGEVLSLVGLEGEGDSRIGGFSLGMRQRLSVAHALLGDPGALVFDEPANGLDPEGIRWMRLLMRRLADEGRTVLVSSHVLSEVEQVADNVLVLSKGRLVLASGIETLADPQGGSVIVDAADRDALRAALAAAGFDIEVLRSGLTVRGGDAGTVGAVAADAGIALSTLVQRGPTLEDVFIDLMRGGRLAPRADAVSSQPVAAVAAVEDATASLAEAAEPAGAEPSADAPTADEPADDAAAPAETVVAVPVAAAAAWVAEATAAPAEAPEADSSDAEQDAEAATPADDEGAPAEHAAPAEDAAPADDDAPGEDDAPAEAVEEVREAAEAAAEEAPTADDVAAVDDETTSDAPAEESALSDADQAESDAAEPTDETERPADESAQQDADETERPAENSAQQDAEQPTRSFDEILFGAAPVPAVAPSEPQHNVAEVFAPTDDGDDAESAAGETPSDEHSSAESSADEASADEASADEEANADDAHAEDAHAEDTDEEHAGVEIFADLDPATDADPETDADAEPDADPRSAAVSSMLAAAARAYYEDEPKDYPLGPDTENSSDESASDEGAHWSVASTGVIDTVPLSDSAETPTAEASEDDASRD